ncbi:MAG: hypothetical protein ACM3ZE_19535 [Myxococcales bacterium]
MNLMRVHFALLCVLWLVGGCAEPAQLGGLGVFNPNGLAGRMTLAGRVNGAAVEGNSRAESTEHRSARSTSQPSEHQDPASR